VIPAVGSRLSPILAASLLMVVASAAAAITPEPTNTRPRTPTPTPTATALATATPTSSLLADANCDRVGSAPDLSAAIIVSVEPEQFPGCRGADLFRGHPLSDLDFLVIYQDLFATFDARWTPTPTASPTVSRTPTRAATRTPTSAVSPTRTPTASPTYTATSTPTRTPSPLPTLTRTVTFTRTPTRTRTPTPSPVPTGIAYQLTGDWFANWGGQICFILGQPFDWLRDSTYRITALDGTLDIYDTVSGVYLGRGLTVEGSGPNYVVRTRYRYFSNFVCQLTGVREEYVYDFVFTLRLNGTGGGAATWSFGENTNCASCRVTDSATLVRTVGPR